jgi:hypothetical protein
MLRFMPTLEPATITGRSYALLFRTGQHPHEFIMELNAQYARPVGDKAMFNIYWAPVGDTAFDPLPSHTGRRQWNCRKPHWRIIGRIPSISRTTSSPSASGQKRFA